MNYWNEKNLREAIANFLRLNPKKGIGDKFRELEARIEALENKRGPGRPKNEASRPSSSL